MKNELPISTSVVRGFTRLSRVVMMLAIVVATSLVQGCVTKPKIDTLNLRAHAGGECQVLDETFPCNDVLGALKKVGVEKETAIQIQMLPGFTVGEAARLLNTLRTTLIAAGYTGVSKTAVAIAADAP